MPSEVRRNFVALGCIERHLHVLVHANKTNWRLARITPRAASTVGREC